MTDKRESERSLSRREREVTRAKKKKGRDMKRAREPEWKGSWKIVIV